MARGSVVEGRSWFGLGWLRVDADVADVDASNRYRWQPNVTGLFDLSCVLRPKEEKWGTAKSPIGYESDHFIQQCAAVLTPRSPFSFVSSGNPVDKFAFRAVVKPPNLLSPAG